MTKPDRAAKSAAAAALEPSDETLKRRAAMNEHYKQEYKLQSMMFKFFCHAFVTMLKADECKLTPAEMILNFLTLIWWEVADHDDGSKFHGAAGPFVIQMLELMGCANPQKEWDDYATHAWDFKKAKAIRVCAEVQAEIRATLKAEKKARLRAEKDEDEGDGDRKPAAKRSKTIKDADLGGAK